MKIDVKLENDNPQQSFIYLKQESQVFKLKSLPHRQRKVETNLDNLFKHKKSSRLQLDSSVIDSIEEIPCILDGESSVIQHVEDPTCVPDVSTVIHLDTSYVQSSIPLDLDIESSTIHEYVENPSLESSAIHESVEDTSVVGSAIGNTTGQDESLSPFDVVEHSQTMNESSCIISAIPCISQIPCSPPKENQPIESPEKPVTLVQQSNAVDSLLDTLLCNLKLNESQDQPAEPSFRESFGAFLGAPISMTPLKDASIQFDDIMMAPSSPIDDDEASATQQEFSIFELPEKVLDLSNFTDDDASHLDTTHIHTRFLGEYLIPQTPIGGDSCVLDESQTTNFLGHLIIPECPNEIVQDVDDIPTSFFNQFF